MVVILVRDCFDTVEWDCVELVDVGVEVDDCGDVMEDSEIEGSIACKSRDIFQ